MLHNTLDGRGGEEPKEGIMADEPEKKPPKSAEESAESALDVISVYLHPGRENVMLIYILYLVGLVPAFGGVPLIVGFIMALLNRANGGEVWASHYEYQFRTAAIGLLFVIVSAILVVVIIGFVGLVLTAIWWLVRSVKGLQAASRTEAIVDPKSYSW
jgi:uncharacterized membrane protein